MATACELITEHCGNKGLRESLSGILVRRGSGKCQYRKERITLRPDSNDLDVPGVTSTFRLTKGQTSSAGCTAMVADLYVSLLCIQSYSADLACLTWIVCCANALVRRGADCANRAFWRTIRTILRRASLNFEEA